MKWLLSTCAKVDQINLSTKTQQAHKKTNVCAKTFREQKNPAFCEGQPGCLFKRPCHQQATFLGIFCMLGQEKGCGSAGDWIAKRQQVWETGVSGPGRSRMYDAKRLDSKTIVFPHTTSSHLHTLIQEGDPSEGLGQTCIYTINMSLAIRS